ncbi:lipopolysaccharide biosynthesis protein [Schaedlerella arabinosiphila]|nr:oligosaccharide flippase family protein [Schaedlerella arabinosiphila]KAI4443535.1 hypothetical protein C824_006071 [Schaedlerella arabinosiphila]
MKKEKSKIQLFVQGSFFLVISNVCLKAINFFLLPLYTKNLTPSMLGISDSITTFTSILFPILVMGLDSAYSAFYYDKEDADRDKKVFSTISFTFLCTGIIPMLMCIVSGPLSELLFHTADYKIIVCIALLSVTLNLWGLSFSLELRLKNKMRSFGIISIMASLSMVLLNIFFVSILKLGESSLILSTAIVAGEHLLLYALFTGSIPRITWFDYGLLKKMVKFSIPLIPTVLMAWVLSLSDRYILLYYYGDFTVGLYGIGARFVTLLNVVISAVTTAYTTFAFGSKDQDNAKRNYYYVFNVLSFLLMGIAFTIAVFSKDIILFMTDDAYSSSYVVIRDMMFGQVFYAMSTIVSYGIIFQKKSIYSLLSVSSGAIVNIIANLVLIPLYGITAAAFTTMIGYLVSLAECYYYSEKLYPCEYGIKRIMITSILLYAVSWSLMETNLMIQIITWGGCVITCMIVYKDVLRLIIEYVIKLLPLYRRKQEEK